MDEGWHRQAQEGGDDDVDGEEDESVYYLDEDDVVVAAARRPVTMEIPRAVSAPLDKQQQQQQDPDCVVLRMTPPRKRQPQKWTHSGKLPRARSQQRSARRTPFYAASPPQSPLAKRMELPATWLAALESSPPRLTTTTTTTNARSSALNASTSSLLTAGLASLDLSSANGSPPSTPLAMPPTTPPPPPPSPLEQARRWFRLRALHFSTASPEAPPPPGLLGDHDVWTDTKTQLYCQQRCRDMLAWHIRLPCAYPNLFASGRHQRPKQNLYLCAGRGWGLRTLVVNCCREWSLELRASNAPGLDCLWVEECLPAWYDPARALPSLDAAQQAFRALYDAALSLGRCVVLLPAVAFGEMWHNPHLYASCGRALFDVTERATQQALEEGRPAGDPVWFVLTGTKPMEACSADFMIKIGSGMAYVEGGMDTAQLLDVMMRAVTLRLLQTGVRDDRPPPLDRYADEEAHRARQRALLEDSFFHRIEQSIRNRMQDAARRFLKAAETANIPLSPFLLRAFVDHAFELARTRHLAQFIHQPPPGAAAAAAFPGGGAATIEANTRALVPTEQDFLQAESGMPFKIEAPGSNAP